MATMEELQKMGLAEFIRSKGHILSAFQREYHDVEKEIEKTSSEISTKEREYDNLYGELYSLRDQLQISEKYINEVKSSKTTVQITVEQMNIHKNIIMEQEQKNKQEIEVYRNRFEDIKALLASGFEWSPEQIEMKNNLEKERDFLQSKYENKMLSVLTLRNDNEVLFNHVKNLEEMILKVEKDTEAAEDKLRDINKKTRAQHKQRELLEKSIFCKRDEMKVIEDEILERKKLLKFEEKSLHELELNLKEIRQRMEDSINEYNKLFHTLECSSMDLERQKVLLSKLEEEVNERIAYNALKKEEYEYYDKECKKLVALREVAMKKIKETEQEKRNVEDLRDNLLKDIQMYETVELKSIIKERDSRDKTVACYRKQIELINKKLLSNDKSNASIDDLIEFHAGSIKAIKIDASIHEATAKQYEKAINQLTSEKEKYEGEIETLSKEYYTSLEELKLQDVQIYELQKKIADDTTKLRHKQNTYESIRSDRNLFSKQLIDSQDNINSLKKTFKVINYSIEQLKDEISIKDHSIVKEHFLHHAVDKERELVRNELIKINKQISASDIIINNQSIEVLKLNRIIEEGRKELLRQQQEFQYIRNEKNVLTSQIIKRNAEISNTYDLIKMQRANLNLGEKKYFTILTEIDSLKKKLKNLILSNNSTMERINDLKQLKYKTINLEKQLLNEKVKFSMLERELDKPMNIHRWRVLEASDPKRFEKITYIQSLQKQIVLKSDQITEIELMIQEKEKVYLELKNIISRQPGVETEEQLLVYQQTHKEKVKQLQAMDEELYMYREQIRVFKSEIQDMDNDIDSMKKNWIKSKRMGGNSAENTNYAVIPKSDNHEEDMLESSEGPTDNDANPLNTQNQTQMQ